MNDIFDESLTLKVQIFAIIGSILLLLLILQLIRKEYLKPGYALLWVFTSLLLLVLSVYSKGLFLLSNAIGIYYAPAALFLVLLIGLLLVCMHFSVTLSKHQKQIKTLAQELAILKERYRNPHSRK